MIPPTVLSLGPLTVYSQGFVLALGFLLFLFLVWKEARRRGLSEEKIFDVVLVAVFLAFLTARLGTVWEHWQFFSTDPVRAILFLKYPGFSFVWGGAALFLFTLLGALASAVNPLAALDILSLSLPLVLSLGYLGCSLTPCFSLPFWLAGALGVFWLVLGLFQSRLNAILSQKAQLAEISRRHGLFTLLYLIFQSLSLLITTSITSSGKWEYLVITVLGVAVFLLRFGDLVKYTHDSISQKRPFRRQQVS